MQCKVQYYDEEEREGQLRFGDRVRETRLRLSECAEEGQWTYWTKDADDGASRKKQERSTAEKMKEDMKR